MINRWINRLIDNEIIFSVEAFDVLFLRTRVGTCKSGLVSMLSFQHTLVIILSCLFWLNLHVWCAKFKAAILAKHLSGNESGSAFPMVHSKVEHFQHVKYSFDLRAFICPVGECFGVSKDLFTPIKCFFPLFFPYWSNTWKQSKRKTHGSQLGLPRNKSVLVSENKMWHLVQTLSTMMSVQIKEILIAQDSLTQMLACVCRT